MDRGTAWNPAAPSNCKGVLQRVECKLLSAEQRVFNRLPQCQLGGDGGSQCAARTVIATWETIPAENVRTVVTTIPAILNEWGGLVPPRDEHMRWAHLQQAVSRLIEILATR